MFDNEGPELIKIPPQPAREYYKCQGCKYYKHQLVRSGNNPIYSNNCVNPNIPEEHKTDKYSVLSGSGNLGKATETPEWCPFLKN